MAGLDNSRYGAAATAAPVLTASARPRRRRVKVFSQVFFKKLAGCGTASHGPKGVARVLVPGGHRLGPTEPAGETRRSCLPIHKKRGTNVPLLGQHKSRCPRAEEIKRVKYRKKPGFMRLSELDPRVESPSLLPLFPCTLDPGGKFKKARFYAGFGHS